MDFSDPVVAALIGAAATVLTALVQLRISWRQELKDREGGRPITRKTRRGPVIAVLVLMIAAAGIRLAAAPFHLGHVEIVSATTDVGAALVTVVPKFAAVRTPDSRHIPSAHGPVAFTTTSARTV